jgi:hypothetical protein
MWISGKLVRLCTEQWTAVPAAASIACFTSRLSSERPRRHSFLHRSMTV